MLRRATQENAAPGTWPPWSGRLPSPGASGPCPLLPAPARPIPNPAGAFHVPNIAGTLADQRALSVPLPVLAQLVPPGGADGARQQSSGLGCSTSLSCISKG